MQIYRQELLDHYRHSPYRGSVEHPDLVTELTNPSCGDTVIWSGQIRDNCLIKVRFQGTGCVISQAAASLLAKEVEGKTIDHVRGMDAVAMRALVGIELGPTRLRCALLPLEALEQGIQSYQAGQKRYAQSPTAHP